ncbi:hypothetical protein D3C80_1762850 [compost metagenome]
MRLHAIRDGQHHVGAVLYAGGAPGVCGGVRRIQSTLNILRVGAGELGDSFPGYRGGVGKVVTGNGFDKFAANIIAVALFERNQRARQTGMDIFHVKHLSKKHGL